MISTFSLSTHIYQVVQLIGLLNNNISVYITHNMQCYLGPAQQLGYLGSGLGRLPTVGKAASLWLCLRPQDF